jgi:nucleoside-diphosphate-sugar epimerase
MGDLILVTGGAGFVGSHLTRKLLDDGYRVRVLDSLVYGKHGLADVEDNPNLELVTGDICDEPLLNQVVSGTRAVIALAAVVGDAACDLDPRRSTEINYESTVQTLEACRRAGTQRLVFASSCSVYGANGSEFLHEDSHLNPVSLYARTRLMSEEQLLRNAGGVEVVILRLATVCGVSPRMRFDLMVNTMTACAAVQRTVRVTGAKQWRPHLHVQDAAEAFKLAMESPDATGGIFNVGCDEQNFTIGEVAEKVAAHIPQVQIEQGTNGGDPRSYRVSFERIKKMLGFRPKRTVDDAIEEVGRLLRSGRIADFTNEQFHNAKWLSMGGRLQGAA